MTADDIGYGIVLLVLSLASVVMVAISLVKLVSFRK